jgi:hypothetical protein
MNKINNKKSIDKEMKLNEDEILTQKNEIKDERKQEQIEKQIPNPLE